MRPVIKALISISLIVAAHTDPVLVEVGALDLQKVLHSSNDVIVTVKTATTELRLYLGMEVAHWGVKAGAGVGQI